MITRLNLDETIELMPATETEEVLQNVRMIVGVWRSEVPLDRDFGIDTDLVDAPMNVARTQLTASLMELIEEYEPRASLKEVAFETGADGAVNPIITVEVKEASG